MAAFTEYPERSDPKAAPWRWIAGLLLLALGCSSTAGGDVPGGYPQDAEAIRVLAAFGAPTPRRLLTDARAAPAMHLARSRGGQARMLQVSNSVDASAARGRGAADDAQVAPNDVLVEVSADTQSPYVQAQVRYRVRVLARVPLRDATLSEPRADGALLQRLGDDRRFDVEHDGQSYRVIERLYAVVAQRPGALTIVSPTLSAAVPLRALTGGTSTDALMERRAVISRSAADLTLAVRPPPAAAQQPWLPAESVSVSEHWQSEPNRVRVGEPIERRIVIEASGVGFGVLALPELPAVDGLRVYPQPPETSQQVLGEDLSVRTILRQTLVPTVPGILRIPEFRLPWWSLGMDAPRQALLPARDLVVLAGATAEDAPKQADAWREHFTERAGADLWGAPWMTLGFALAWLATLGLWLRERRRVRSQGAVVEQPDAAAMPPSSELVTRFRNACQVNDPKAARDALGAWALNSGRGRYQRGLAAALRARGAGDEVLALVQELDRHVYGGAGVGPETGSATWSGEAARRAIVPLLKRTPDCRDLSEQVLPPLFPEQGTSG